VGRGWVVGQKEIEAGWGSDWVLCETRRIPLLVSYENAEGEFGVRFRPFPAAIPKVKRWMS
jgi:hypothetical protein